jgi:hypothetical protein
MVEIVYSEDINHYAYTVTFLYIVIGLLWGRSRRYTPSPHLSCCLSSPGSWVQTHLRNGRQPSIFTVMALTGLLKKILPFDRIIDLLGNSSRGVLIKKSLITATLIGFINKTPVVALLIPLLKTKAQERNWNVGRFLMPPLLRRSSRRNDHLHRHFDEPCPQWTHD